MDPMTAFATGFWVAAGMLCFAWTCVLVIVGAAIFHHVFTRRG